MDHNLIHQKLSIVNGHEDKIGHNIAGQVFNRSRQVYAWSPSQYTIQIYCFFVPDTKLYSIYHSIYIVDFHF